MEIALFIIIIFIFQGAIERILPVMGYIDELSLILFSSVVFIKYATRNIEIKMYKEEKIIFICTALFFLLGIISSLKTSLNNSIMNSIISGILSIKFFIVYFLARILFRDISIHEKSLNRYSYILNILLNIYLIIILLNIPLNFLQVNGIRYGLIKSVSVGFEHPAQLDFMAIAIMVMQLFIYSILGKNMKNYNMVLIKSFIIIVFAGRIKALVFFVAYITFLFCGNIVKNIKVKYIFLGAPVALIIAKERIISEFIQLESVRGTLYRVGFKIGKDFWPLGSGFGTFGTEYSRKYYSDIYYKYGISNKYGLSPDWPAYITDAHWAAIVGECGFIGLLIYAIICISFTCLLFRIHINDWKIKLSLVSLWIYAIVSSLSDTILIEYRGVAIALITAFFISVINKKNKNII